jgi:hypothetical protein
MAYARRLTKEDLERAGITDITEDGRVFRQGLEIPLNITPNGYHTLWIYDLDKDGNYIKYGHTANGHYYYRQRMIGLHRAMWAWHYGEVPEGYVVDPINNSRDSIEDYERLQMVSRLYGPQNADEICRSFIKSKFEFSRESRSLFAARRQLGDILDKAAGESLSQ